MLVDDFIRPVPRFSLSCRDHQPCSEAVFSFQPKLSGYRRADSQPGHLRDVQNDPAVGAEIRSDRRKQVASAPTRQWGHQCACISGPAMRSVSCLRISPDQPPFRCRRKPISAQQYYCARERAFMLWSDVTPASYFQ